MDREQARRRIEAALQSAGTMRAMVLLALGGLLGAPGGIFSLLIVDAAITDPASLTRGRSDDVAIMLATVLLVIGSVACVVAGARSFGARGTPGGRKLLDFPASCEAVRYSVREITAAGGVLRTVHVVDLDFDDGSSQELQVDRSAVRGLLEALRAWLPPSSHVDEGPR